MSSITETYKPAKPAFLHGIARARRDGHRYLMSSLRDPSLCPEEPRKDAQLLWNVDLEQELLIVRRRSDVPFEPAGGKLVHQSSENSIPEDTDLYKPLTIRGNIARQYSPLIKRDPEVEDFFHSQGMPVPKRPRSRLQPVRTEDLNSWIKAKLERLGLQVHGILALPIADIRLSDVRKTESLPVATFQAQISGSPEVITELIENGFGRAKNYGVGLIQISHP